MERGGADDPNVIFVDAGNPPGVNFAVSSLVTDPHTGDSSPTPKNLAAWLTANPYLHTDASTHVTLGGVAATRIDATATGARDSSGASCGNGCLGLFDFQPGSYSLTQGERAQFYVLHVDGHQLLVALDDQASDFDRFLPQAKAMLASVQFG